MPCTKCKDENYKWGKTGSCKYATKEECERANPKKYNKMNPTPLGKKTYEEYAKELKEFNLSKVEKVDLGLMQDVLKLYNKIEGFKDDMDGQLSKAKMSATKVDSEIKNFEKLAGDVEKTAKELGIPVKDMNLQKLYTNIKEWKKDADIVLKA